MMGRLDLSYHVDPRSLEDGVVGGSDVEDTKFRDDVERVGANWEHDCTGGAGFAPVKIVEERLCQGVDKLPCLFGSILHSIQSMLVKDVAIHQDF